MLVGNRLTTGWQKEEWNRQQRVRLLADRVEQQERIANDLITAVGNHTAAVQDVVWLYRFTPTNGIPTNKAEHIANWNRARRQWETDAVTLRQRLPMYFSDSTTARMFDRIVTMTNTVNTGVELLLLLERKGEDDWDQQASAKEEDILRQRSVLLQSDLPRVVRAMREEELRLVSG